MTRARLVALLPSNIFPVALVAVMFTAPAVAQQRLSLHQYMDIESVSNPRISPDGARIVYTKGWIDKRNDRRESALWMMNADGSRKRHLVDGGGGAWSPDGTRILYTAPGDPGGSQLHVRWMDAEGLSTQITRLENGPSNPR